MAAYMIFIREGEVVDEAAMQAYKAGNSGGPPLSGMRALSVYGAIETVEGEAADGMVILEFPDKAAAKAWYFSPEYQERAKLRQQAAPYRAFIVEGL
jgi:uncharacterized protein (DUF1330 family)